MADRIFLKLGGSLLTDKARPRSLRADVLNRLATEIATALDARPGLELLIGQGGGSFAHTVALQYGTRDGVASQQDWRGYAATARAAAELNRVVIEVLGGAAIPVLPIQPSASALCLDGELRSMVERPIRVALANGLVPLVYGDVALDETRGGTIVSTEQIFRWLAPRLAPTRILLVGEVAGVLTADPAVGVTGEIVPVITPTSYLQVVRGLGGARGLDVTGGMAAKVAEMLALLQATPSLSAVQVVSGLVPGLVRDCLMNSNVATGTRIIRNSA